MVSATLKLILSSALLMVLMPTAASPRPTGPNVSMNTLTSITPGVAPLLQKTSLEAWANQCVQAFQVVGALPVKFIPSKDIFGPYVPSNIRDMAAATQYQMPDINVST